jgi:hypothetical protein
MMYHQSAHLSAPLRLRMDLLSDSVKGGRLASVCSTELRKHVFPRFTRPATESRSLDGEPGRARARRATAPLLEDPMNCNLRPPRNHDKRQIVVMRTGTGRGASRLGQDSPSNDSIGAFPQK